MDNKQENKTIHISLPNELYYRTFLNEVQSCLSKNDIDVNFLKFKHGEINVNLKEHSSNISPELGYSFDNKNNLYFKDRPSLLFHLNKKLKAFCFLPAQKIIKKNILGIDGTSSPKKSGSGTINFYSQKFTEDHLTTAINRQQVVSDATVTNIIETINNNTYKKINLYGELDYLVPFIEPRCHCEIRLYDQSNKIRHALETIQLNGFFVFNIKSKNHLSSFIFESIYLSMRKVLAEIDYTIPMRKILACRDSKNELSHVLKIIETYYDLLIFGQKYSQYLFEDSKNTADEKTLIKQQKKIQEVCSMIRKIETQFFGLEIFNELLFLSLETMPPASIAELALLQKEAFVETSLVTGAFFDLVSSTLKILSQDKNHYEK